MARSLNKVALIGNLTRDPELRYTPKGTAVCTFGLATNRQWTTDSGEKREEADFHRIVAWNKLAELCAQLLGKGRKVYVEGRLQTRNWQTQDGTQRTTTEIVINDMIILDSRKEAVQEPDFDVPDEDLPPVEKVVEKETAAQAKKTKEAKKEEKEPEKKKKEEDIPF
jgi:single-strand DNA-binding protein